MGYLVAAYAVLWAISFILVFSMWWRQRRIEVEIQVLQQMLKDRRHPESGVQSPDHSPSV